MEVIMNIKNYKKILLILLAIAPMQSQAMWRTIGQRLGRPAALMLTRSVYLPGLRTFNGYRLPGNLQARTLCYGNQPAPIGAQKAVQPVPFFTDSANTANWRLSLALGIPLLGWFFKTEEQKQQDEQKVKLIEHLETGELEHAKAVFNQLVLKIDQERLVQELFLHIIKIDNSCSHQFLEELITQSPQATETLISFLIKECRSNKGQKLLERLAQNEALNKLFLLIAQQQIEKHLKDPEEHFSDSLQLIFLLKLNHSNQSIEYQTPTERHLWTHINQVLRRYSIVQKYFSEENLRHILQQINQREREFNNAGYITFFHGQQSKYTFIEEWFTKLWGLKNNRSIKEFLFAHVKQVQTGQQTTLRTEIVGRGESLEQDRQHLLFMNYAFFNNSTNLASCTANYILTNNNYIKPSINLETAFELNGYQKIYQQFKSQLEELEREYQKLCNYGSLLLIAIPQEHLADCVYLARPGGDKKAITIDGQETNDINLIMHTLRTNPEKIKDTDLEFCLVMTQDNHGGMNPDSGIKIIPIRAVDPEEWKAFEAQQDALFEKIKAAIIKQQTP